MRKITSSAEDRHKDSNYLPFKSYTEYRDHVLMMAAELNEIVDGIPIYLIPDYWLHSSRFRAMFKRMAYAAHHIHYEEKVQTMMPWCYVNIAEYARRFDVDTTRNVSHSTPQAKRGGVHKTKTA